MGFISDISTDTIEEEVLERARNKMILEHLVISMGVTDKEVTDKVKKGKDGPTSAELSAILKVRNSSFSIRQLLTLDRLVRRKCSKRTITRRSSRN